MNEAQYRENGTPNGYIAQLLAADVKYLSFLDNHDW